MRDGLACATMQRCHGGYDVRLNRVTVPAIADENGRVVSVIFDRVTIIFHVRDSLFDVVVGGGEPVVHTFDYPPGPKRSQATRETHSYVPADVDHIKHESDRREAHLGNVFAGFEKFRASDETSDAPRFQDD